MRLNRGKTEPTVTSSTPAEQLEGADRHLRQAHAADREALRHLTEYECSHPPRRRPFLMNGGLYMPVNVMDPPELLELYRKKRQTAQGFQDALEARAKLRATFGLLR